MAFVTNDPTNYIGFGVQPAKDTEVAPYFFFRHLDGTGFDVDADTQTVREGGDGQERGFSYKRKVTSDGAIAAYARPQAAGRQWAWVAGIDTVACQVGSAIFHHLARPAASSPYLTAEQLAPADLLERVGNVVLTSLTEEFEAGEPLRITTEFMAAGSLARRNSASALTVARETAPVFRYPGASVFLTVDAGAGGAATSVKVTKGKVDIKRGVDDGIQTTGLTREDLALLTLDVDADITLRYEDVNLYSRAYYQGAGSGLNIDFATGTLNLYSARGSFFHQLNLPVLEVHGAKLNRLDPDGKTVYVDIAAVAVKAATNSVFAITATPDPTSYVTY